MSGRASRAFDIKLWVKRILGQGGGFASFVRHEGGGIGRADVAAWVIRCLANPTCEGSQEVLDAIVAHRAEVLRLANGSKDA